MANGTNPFEMYGGDVQSALASSRALAEQMRRGQQVQLAGALGSPNAIQAMGGVMGGQAQDAAKMLEQAGAARMHYGPESWANKMAIQQQKDQAAYQRSLIALQRSMALLGMRQNAYEFQQNEKLRTALDPTGPRAGNLGNYQKRVAVLGDLQRLLAQYPNPTSQQYYEIARAFDNAISQGAISISGTKHIIPEGLIGDVNKMAAYFTSTPRGANMPGYHDLLSDMTNTQKNYWENELHGDLDKRVGSFRATFQRFPESSADTLASLGYDPTRIQSHPFYGRQGFQPPNPGAARVAPPGGAPGAPPGGAPKLPTGTRPPGATHFSPSTGKYYDKDGKEISVGPTP